MPVHCLTREEDGHVQQKTQSSSTAVCSILEWLECARLQFETAVCRIQEMAKERPGYMLALLFAVFVGPVLGSKRCKMSLRCTDTGAERIRSSERDCGFRPRTRLRCPLC